MMKKMVSLLLSVLIGISMLVAVPVTANEVGAGEGISVGAISFYGTKDASGEILPDLSGASQVSAKVHIENHSDALEKVGVYVAYYAPNHMLLNVDFGVTEFAAGQEETVSVGMDIAKATPGRYVRAFVWSETNHALAPLVKEQTLMATENIYVAPGGNDQAAGTFAEPLQTVTAARDLVRTRNEDMTEDIFVYLRGGTYQLDDTLSFDEADSGTNEKLVRYQAYNDEAVVLSGGTKVEGWTLYDTEQNIWRTQVSGTEPVRELYVNGQKAQRAKGEARVYPEGFYKETVDGVEKVQGYIVSGEDVGLYKNATDIQLHYTRIWKNTLCNVSEIVTGEEGKTIIKMDPTAFSKAIAETAYVPLTEDISFYIENAYELLDTAGEFYFDKQSQSRYLYYKPEEGQDMTTVDAYVPVLERLMEIRGSDLNNTAENISFSGITFAHATRSDTEEGYLGDQAQSKTTIHELNSSHPLDNTIVGSNIRISKAKNIYFTDNSFVGLSAVGLGLYDGVDGIKIEGNCFYDLGDSAITVGLPTDAYMDEAYTTGRNVALFKPVTSCGATRTSATNANDGNRTTIWGTPNSNATDYWQVDLGKPYTISEVRVKSRLGTTASATATYRSQTVHRQDFEILASNDEEFSDGGTSLAVCTTPFDYDAGFVGVVESTEKFRYVRFKTTKNKYIYLAELEVISPDQTAPMQAVCKNTMISNNYITRIGEVNYGAPGIQLYYTENVDIAHNLIRDVPYSGICVGWGWTNTTDSVTAKNNTVRNNVIDGFAQRTYDAGGVYLLGTQANTQVTGNYIKNQTNIYYAFYADSGSENFTVQNNVFDHVDMAFALGREGNVSAKKGMVVTDNYASTACYTFALSEGNNSVVEAPTFYFPTKAPAAVGNIIEEAGLEAAFTGLTEKVPVANRTLTIEDMYGNVIDRHVERLDDTIGSLSDINLINYYMDNPIKTAKKMYNESAEFASVEARTALYNAYRAAEIKRVSYQNAFTNPETGEPDHTLKNVDRRSVIETRLTLLSAMETFLQSLS